MRKKIKISIRYYKRLHKLSEVIGIPKATLITMMVTDTIDEKAYAHFGKRNKKTAHKDEHIHEKERYINITLSSEYENKLINIVDELQCTITDFILNCIDYQFAELNIIENDTNKDFITDTRIYHSESYYSDETIKSHKPNSLIKQYLEMKAEQYNVSPKILAKYYISKYLNNIFRERESERILFKDENEYADINQW